MSCHLGIYIHIEGAYIPRFTLIQVPGPWLHIKRGKVSEDRILVKVWFSIFIEIELNNILVYVAKRLKTIFLYSVLLLFFFFKISS